MLARVLMQENAHRGIRINELVIHSSFGWGKDEDNQVTGADVGRFIGHLLFPEGEQIRNRTIHLTPEALDTLPGSNPALQAGA